MRGHVDAQVLLAELYIHGVATGKAGTETARLGSANSVFDTNDTGDPDFSAAYVWAHRAAQEGSPTAQALHGYILTSGPETLRDVDAAQRWYQLSATAGCPQGHLGYALSLVRSQSADSSIQRRMADHAKLAAESSLPTALHLMGQLTELGLGVARDQELALQYYRQAAERGNRSAQLRWGIALLEGSGGVPDPFAGESWIRKAALAGDPDAAARLGDLYAKTTPLPPNYVEASNWVPNSRRMPATVAQRARWACCISPESPQRRTLRRRHIGFASRQTRAIRRRRPNSPSW